MSFTKYNVTKMLFGNIVLFSIEGMPTGNQSHGISPVLTSFSSDSAYSGSYKTQPSSEEEEQRGGEV